MSASVCSRCLERPPLPSQRWCRTCFAVYRREQRARKREARGQEGVTGDRTTGVAQSVTRRPEESVTVVPSLTVKISPFNFLLRFPGGRINPEDVPTLQRLRPGALYEGYAWVEREKQ